MGAGQWPQVVALSKLSCGWDCFCMRLGCANGRLGVLAAAFTYTLWAEHGRLARDDLDFEFCIVHRLCAQRVGPGQDS